MLRFKIQDWYNLHSGFTLSLTHPYTALIGPNGAGKTTLLNQLNEAAQRRRIPVLRYSDLDDGRKNALDSILFQGQMRTLALYATSSEGECMRMSFFQKMDSFKKKLSHGPGSPTLLLIDSLDSGSSIDAQRFLRDELEKLAEEYPVYIVIAANSYEFVQGADCVDVRSGKHKKFKSYEKYASFICEYYKVHSFRLYEKEESETPEKVEEPVTGEVPEAGESDVRKDKAPEEDLSSHTLIPTFGKLSDCVLVRPPLVDGERGCEVIEKVNTNFGRYNIQWI